MPEEPLSIALLGAGKMGSALLGGWLDGSFEQSRFFVFDPAPDQTVAALERDNVSINPSTSEIPEPDLVVVAVKPQIFPDALPAIKPICGSKTLLISVAAGETIGEFEDAFGVSQPVVRAMPNTPATIGAGITALIANGNVSSAQRDLASKLLVSVGSVVWLDSEEQMDAVTALSGSGPAYVFLLTECMTQAGISQGLSPELARNLARATVSGAGALMAQSDDDAATLRENVTSPGGTTEAALAVLRSEDGLQRLMEQAIDAATKRSKELGK